MALQPNTPNLALGDIVNGHKIIAILDAAAGLYAWEKVASSAITTGFQGEVADEVALLAAAALLPEPGNWWWVQDDGEYGQGAYRQLIRTPVALENFSGPYGDYGDPIDWSLTGDDFSQLALTTTGPADDWSTGIDTSSAVDWSTT